MKQNMNLLNRLIGVIVKPQQTFKFLAERPLWIDALIIILVSWTIFSYFAAPYSLQDDIRILESSVKLRERVGESQFEQDLEKMKNFTRFELIRKKVIPVPFSLLFGFLISSLVLLGLGRLVSTKGKFMQIFSAYLHANLINSILGNCIRLFFAFSQKSVLTLTASPAIFFSGMDITSPAFVILSKFDFFQLWVYGVLSLGLSTIFRISIKKALIISYGFWFLKSLLYVLISLFVTQLMR
jgi:hypothetical protein